jgi:hypothetical protein
LLIFKICEYICKTKYKEIVLNDSFKSKDMKIRIHPEFKSQMALEFDTSKQNVKMALDYYNNSELAKKIRARAKALLLSEGESIKSED